MGWTIREAELEDAEAMLRYATELFAEPGLDLPTAPGEFQVSVEQEREVIQTHHTNVNHVFLLAVSDAGDIIGMLNCHGSTRQALRHRCELGISVARAYRGKGVGTALLEAALKWARGTGAVTRIQLHVYVRNRHAIRLYQRFGFVEEGRLRQGVFQEGQYLDELLMAVLL